MRTLLLLTLALGLAACSTGPMNNPTRPSIELDAGSLSSSATIVGNASTQPALSDLVAALQRAGLVDALNGAGPFTVFAPINAAFEDIDAASLDMDELQNILKYHVVEGRLTASDLTEGTRLVTMAEEGQGLTISRLTSDRTQLTVNGADIIYADIPASNGVIHLIDVVLTPESGGEGR